MEYHPIITPQMREVNRVLVQECVGMNHCISLRGRNLVVEVAKSDIPLAIDTLKKHFPDVVDIRKAYLMLEDLHDFILVKPLVSEAPFIEEEDIPVPSMEKLLVDGLSDKDFAALSTADQTKRFQSAFERYRMNTSKLQRYAARKGKKEEADGILSLMNRGRIQTVQAICSVLQDAPVEKAWLFGSFARMEERKDSDIDVLVQFDHQHPIGLFAFSSLVEKLETAAGRKVDLVAEGSLKPFAVDNVEKDKVLVYERARQR